jgi:hypothetical protein
MLNTYIKNRGTTKTIIHDNSNSYTHHPLNAVNELKWDADYDGDVANISITSDTNGEKKHFNITLDKNDLEHILNVPSVDMPIHKRLKKDFFQPTFTNEPTIYKIELPQIEIPQIETPPFVPMPFEHKNNHKIKTLEQIFDTPKPIRYLSTPLQNEELIIPASINKKHVNHNVSKRTKHKKTHKTYRVYKKYKTITPPKSIRKSSRRSVRNRTAPITIF